jgi:hypothetical protein
MFNILKIFGHASSLVKIENNVSILKHFSTKFLAGDVGNIMLIKVFVVFSLL